jgi:MFS family permease
MKLNINLNSNEKKTFRLHLTHSIIEGIILGILVLNQFVFIKSLNGSSYLLGILFQFSVVAFVFLIFFNEFIKRTIDKKNMLRKISIITRLPLLIFLFFPTNTNEIIGNDFYNYIFLIIFLIFYLSDPIIYPTTNLLLKNNYTHQNFGKFYSYSMTINKIIALITTFVYGILLDINNYIFVYIFPLMGILGILSIFILSNINYENNKKDIIKSDFSSSILKSFNNVKNILKSDKSFFDFELGFMFYGFAFMVTVTIITLFFDIVLNLNYISVAFYKNAYLIIAIILTPIFGRLIGKIDPRKFAIFTFISMIISIFGLILTDLYPFYLEFFGIKMYLMIIFYILFYGIFTATMALLWHIGSAYFCEKTEVDIYQSIHLSATGVRGIFAPIFGVILFEMIGFIGTFVIAILSLLIAILIMFISTKKRIINNNENN